MLKDAQVAQGCVAEHARGTSGSSAHGIGIAYKASIPDLTFQLLQAILIAKRITSVSYPLLIKLSKFMACSI